MYTPAQCGDGVGKGEEDIGSGRYRWGFSRRELEGSFRNRVGEFINSLSGWWERVVSGICGRSCGH